MTGSLRALTLVLIPLFNAEPPAARTDMVTDLMGTWRPEFPNETANELTIQPSDSTEYGRFQARVASSTSFVGRT
jgi:hypothetical protein